MVDIYLSGLMVGQPTPTMPHFNVLVVGEKVDEQLAPYDENRSDSPRGETHGRRAPAAHGGPLLDSTDLAALAGKLEDWIGPRRR